MSRERIKDIQLPAERVQMLIHTRKQHRAVERAYKCYQTEKADRPILSSPRMDGMPRASLNTGGLERRYIHLEKYRQRLEREQKALQQAQEKARTILYSLPDSLQDFCYWYYLEGMNMPDVAKWMERDISTCWRYKKAIEGETA